MIDEEIPPAPVGNTYSRSGGPYMILKVSSSHIEMMPATREAFSRQYRHFMLKQSGLYDAYDNCAIDVSIRLLIK